MEKEETEVKREWYNDKKHFLKFIHQASRPSRSDKTCFIRSLKYKKMTERILKNIDDLEEQLTKAKKK